MTRRRRLRVLVLTHRDLHARDSIENLTEREVLPWRTEYQVVRGLEALGHEVLQLGLDVSLAPLEETLSRFEPHIVWNLLMELRDSGGFEPHIVSALEVRGVPYTGCNSEGLVLCRDKGVAKQLLRGERIPVPEFATFRRGRAAGDVRDLPFPLIVKPIDDGGSNGISRASLVRSHAALRKRVTLIHQRFETDAIAERYIPGREITVGLIGNRRPRCLPLWEIFFDELPESQRILTTRLKWDLSHRNQLGVRSEPARRLRPGVRDQVLRFARRGWETLRLSGFARFDFRLDAEERPFLIDVNPNPDLDVYDDFARAAKSAGIAPNELLQQLLELGLRHRPRWA